MAFWDRPFQRSLILSGEVLVVRLTVHGEGPEGDEVMWSIVRQEGYRLREEVARVVHEHMGPEFDVRSMSFAQGSLEVLVVVGTLYYAVSRYKNFMESIELLIAQLKRALAVFFQRRVPTPAPVSVQGSWTPGPGLIQAAPRMSGAATGDGPGITVAYLILSHAAMLAVLLWLLVRSWRL